MRLTSTAFEAALPDEVLRQSSDKRLSLWWLGQAGFLLSWRGKRMLIDAYLSDSLAEKYRDSEFAHERMMAAPIEAAQLPAIDIYFITHGHSDHMDPGTVAPIAVANPDCIFVVPAAEEAKALERGIAPSQLRTIDAGQTLDLADGLRVHALASAHETIQHDSHGRTLHLGYVIDCDGARIYHSGDCVPFEGQAEALRALAPDLALLPVNGRDDVRAERGVPGNFHAHEAAELCCAAGIPLLIPHHIGMFDFNTVSQDEVSAALLPYGDRLSWYHASLQTRYDLEDLS